ncbi:MAG TPA: glycosyltransferase, partial [bacterium]|nr:glycosyltransferase [bacterium]
AQGADFVFLPSFTHPQVAFVKSALPSLPLVFDPLISKYMTRVLDYRQVSRFSIRALHNWLKDKVSLTRADLVVCDTAANATYFHEHFRIPREKLSIVPVGVNTELFRPVPELGAARPQGGTCLVGFYGGFIPLQGVQVIVDAARLLESHREIAFELVGTGFQYRRILAQLERSPLPRMHLPGWVPYEQLNARINAYDICLGIFGTGPKTDLVVPNKVFHYAACGKPIITKDTPAIREVFHDGSDISLVPPTPEALAARILALWADPARRDALGRQARRLMEQDYSEVRTAQRLLDAFLQWQARQAAPAPSPRTQRA